MNSLKNLQRRLAENGEVELKRGVRWVGNSILVFGFSASVVFVCAGALRMTWEEGIHSAGDVAELLVIGFFFLFGVLCAIAYPLSPFVPVLRKMGRMRITREGFEIAGIWAPWQAIEDTELIFVDRAGIFAYPQILFVPESEASQVVWDDGSKSGRQQAEFTNSRRVLSLCNADLNVRPKTLCTFLMWARDEYGTKQ